MYIGTQFPYKGHELTDSQYRMLNSEDKKLFTKELEENDIIDDVIDIGIGLGIGMTIKNIFSSDDDSSSNTTSGDDFDFGGGSSGGGGADGGW